jgi:hypothetical protein
MTENNNTIVDAQKIDKVTIVAGRLVRVKNTKKPKFSNAKDEYLAVWIEDANSKNERCILLTQRELDIAEKRAKRNLEDLPKKSFIQDLLD